METKYQMKEKVENSDLSRDLRSDGTSNHWADGDEQEPLKDSSTAAKSAQDKIVDESIVESQTSKLSLIQLKKYYKWRNLGVDNSEALVKAKEFGLKPPTNDPHPNCKLSWAEINQISLLIPARHIRSKFQVETYFGGKDPEGQLKRTLSSSKERHPDCKHTWEELMKMANELPKVTQKLKFVVETFYEGGKPKEILRTMLPAVNPITKPFAFSETLKDSVEKNVGSTCDKISEGAASKSDIAKQALEKILQYKRFILGSSSNQTVVGAEDQELAQKTKEPCSSTSSGCYPDSSFSLETYYNDPTIIEGGTVIRNLVNGKLKYYFHWRNAGYDNEHALSNANDLKEFPGEHLPHPKCKLSYEKLKKLSSVILDRVARERFLILTYYGGKELERTTRYFIKRTGKPDDPEDVWYSFDKHLEAIEKIGLGNGKLKYYYLWLNKGYNHKEALARIAGHEKIGGEHRKHPDCKYYREELMKIAQALQSDTHAMARFIIHTFFGGKDPDSTLKYFLSRSTGNDEPEDILAEESVVEDRIYEPLELIKKSNGNLKFYYLWRNEGFDHETALSKVAKMEKFPGTHLKHPNCKHTRFQLTKISRGLKSDKHLQERFLVMTCFGGFDPEATLRYLKSGSRQENESEDEEAEESCRKGLSDSYNDSHTIEDGPIRNLVNKKLKYYYLWRNTGYDEQRALKKACNSLIPRQQSSHPECMHSQEELRKMSQELTSDPIARDRFLIHTYFGGKDPRRTLRYFVTRFGNVDKLKDFSASTVNDSVVDPTSRSDSIAQEKFLIHTYFGGKPRSEREPKPVEVYGESSSCENESYGNVSDPPESQRTKTLEDYLRKGLPYSVALAKVKGQDNSLDLRKPRSALPLPFERTSSCAHYPGIIPLNSQNHPYNQLVVNQLKNYYMWINQGCSHEEAMAKAKTPKLFPACSSSVSSVPLEQLKSMSKRLPSERLVKLFIIETYYAGVDPHEMMELLLSKGHCISASCPQKLSSMIGKMKKSKLQLPTSSVPMVISDQKMDLVSSIESSFNEMRDDRKESSSFESELSNPHKVEDEHTRLLSNGLLKCYYLWCNKIGPELALKKVKNSKNFPGSHFPHPHCKHSKLQLEQMAQALLPDISACDRFFIHTYYGGKDPESARRCFLASEKTSNSSIPGTSHQEQSSQSVAGLPSVPLGYRTAGMPSVQPPYVQQPRPPGHAAMPPYQYQDVGSSFAAYQDYRPPIVSQTGMHPSNEIPMVGMGASLAYPPYGLPPPNQHSMTHPRDQSHAPMAYASQPQEPMIYANPPLAPMGYSGYPHALGPSTVTYQRNHASLPSQQPPPFIDSTSCSSTQSDLSKPGQPHVGEDDRTLSSLIRRPTNKFPIKIKFKSPSEAPTQPKKVCREENRDKLVSPVVTYIVLSGYPKDYLTESQMNAIERSMLEAILEMDDDGTKPIFKDPSHSNGRYGITCIDQFSVNWLYKFLSTYQPWPGASLKLISSLDTKTRANVVLPPCKEDDNDIILRYIAKQNKELNVNKWTVMERWDGDLNTCMDLIVDKESATVLQKCSRIGFKLGIAEIVLAKNDGPPASRWDDRNKRPSRPSSRSSTPLDRPYETDTARASSSRSSGLRKHGNSPPKSFCSPSQDSFGRATSSTHSSRSPLQDSGSRSSSPSDSYDRNGAFWKTNKRSASRSPSRDVSSSPEPFRRPKKCSRKSRRRSDSSSSLSSDDCRSSQPRKVDSHHKAFSQFH